MWRFIKTIPRAARINWNSARSAPQSICHEDDANEEHVCTSSCQSASLKKHTTVQLRNRSFGAGKREYSENYDGNQGSEDKAEKDSWFEEWLRGFHKKNGAFAQANSMPEAVGWGAVLLLGSQIAQLQKKTRKENLCPVRHLYRLARAMPRSGTLTRQYMLHPGAAKPDYALAKQHQDGEKQIPNHDVSTNEGDDGEVVGKGEDQENPFAKAEKEWDHLFKLYDGVARNTLGYQKAQRGHFREALSHWKTASFLGYSKSHFNLGVCYELGKSVEKNINKAIEHYQYAADDGHPKAQYNLAVLYLQGKGDLPCDSEKAISLLRAAAEHGFSKAQTELGVLYTEEDRKDMQKAATFFQMAAEQEDKIAQYYLAICYERGWGVEENACRAAELYKKASDNGHAQASQSLGVFFEKGLGGLPEDAKAALDLYHSSAQQGNISAEVDISRVEKKLQETAKAKKPKNHHEVSLDKRALVGSSSFAALTEYLQLHLHHFDMAGTDSSLFNHPAKINPPPMYSKKSRKLQTDVKEENVRVKFVLGGEYNEDLSDSDNITCSPAIHIDYSEGAELTQWSSDSKDSGFASESRSCSFNELHLRADSDIDMRMVSCS